MLLESVKMIKACCAMLGKIAAMESGLLRSDAGMYGRYLTGTSVPLTKVPLDTSS